MSKYTSLKPMLGYLRPYKKDILLACIALIIASSSVLSIGLGLKHLIDQGFAQGRAGFLNMALLSLFGIAAILAFASYARHYYVTKLGERVIADLRRDVFAKLVSLHPGFYETTSTGELVARLTSDTAVLQVMVGSSLSVALRNILILIGGLGMLMFTSPSLFAYVAFIVPLVVMSILSLARKVRASSRLAQDKVAAIGSFINESLGGIKAIQAYGREGLENRQFLDVTTQAFDAAVARVKLRSQLLALVILLGFGAVGLVLWIGGRQVLTGTISAGELSSFVFYAILVASSLGAISEVYSDLQRASGAAERLVELLNTENNITAPAKPVPLPKSVKGSVVFENVTFHYPSKPTISSLENISFAVTPGETVAIVGPSGAGKSTIFQLLLRFYDPKGGRITLEGKDIKTLSLETLRKQFAHVSQETVIFSNTARENIRFGREEATDEEVIEAAKAARAYDFISRLPQGFDSTLGERGVRLSGGERQRIAIARAMLRKPKILLLDEATNALDAENETLVQQALDEIMQRTTTLIIAHRLSTVISADQIIVMDQGKIVATDKHRTLLKSSPLYAKLASLQMTG